MTTAPGQRAMLAEPLTSRPPGARTRPARRAARQAAASLPVARVAVDVPLPHLDRLFDYLVPDRLAADAVPGCRVRVRFAGRLTGGYLVERAEATEHAGRLAFLERVLSPEPVLTPEIAGLARAVADRYGGTLADVLRLAIPPRHAAAEASAGDPAAEASAGDPAAEASAGDPAAKASAGDQARPRPGAAPAAGPWARYLTGPEFVAALAGGRSPRAVWSALPGTDWPAEIAAAAAATAASGRGALIVVPDARDLGLVDAALAGALGERGHVSLSAQLGPAERYRRWLAVLRGEVAVVAGTRSAAFAPVASLGLVAIWDDGDDLHAEPRAPYPHARDVLLLRAHRCGAAVLVGGFARTAEAAQLVATGWARPLAAARDVVREHAPLVRTAGEDAELARDEAARSARMPGVALRAAREALAAGPVLFQVPRRGYLAAVACRHCGARVRCGSCAGPAALGGPGQPLRCGWCGTAAGPQCPGCGGTGLRALVTGERRTAEELGRAFPGLPVRTSSGPRVLATVPGSAAIVIATPGAEPAAQGGYAAAVLLDSWALLGRPSLRAGEEALRRWMNAAALVRPGPAGGRVVLVADSSLPPVQALIRWDAATHADRELAEREELRLPPAARMAAVTGPPEAVRELLAVAVLPAHADLLGPVPAGHIEMAGAGTGRHEAGGDQPGGDQPGREQPGREQAGREQAGRDEAGRDDGETVRYLVRAPSAEGTALAVALRGGMAERSARKSPGTVRVQLDPAGLI